MKKLTAMQQMYDSMLKNEEKAFELGLPEAGGYQSARILAERLLESEKQIIIDAYDAGVRTNHGIQTADFKHGDKYFNQTFNNTQTK